MLTVSSVIDFSSVIHGVRNEYGTHSHVPPPPPQLHSFCPSPCPPPTLPIQLLSPPPLASSLQRMSFLQSFAVGLLSYARRKPFRAMAWLSFIHWVLNFARRFYNRLVNDRFIRKIPSPKALLHPILGMVPSLAVSLTGTGIMNLGHNITPHALAKHTGERSLPPYPATASLVLLRKAFSRLPPGIGS